MNESVTLLGLRLPLRTESFKQALNLFLTGFLILSLELACIRWFAARVVSLQFFTNTVLLASFIGISCGCLAARHKRNWLALFPLIGLFAVVGALAVLATYLRWQGAATDVGHQASPQGVFFGANYRDPDVARFPVPVDLIVTVFFVLIALMFAGLGQVLGQALEAYPNRVLGYALNVGGSLAGIVAFTTLSFLQVEPVVWFVLVAAGIAYLLAQAGQLSTLRVLTLLAFLLAVAFPYLRERLEGSGETVWSPYYAVRYTPWNRTITVNNIGNQQIVPFSEGGASYSLVHLLERSAGGPPFKDVLVIGAGSGNDIDHALHHGVRHIDAVEIDPAILRIGLESNPDDPYADRRVGSRIDDGRHFLRVTNQKYDLVVYGLVDSLIVHSSYSNLRLESYLFTREAFDDVKRVLKPGGAFVIYNYFRQGWVVERIAAMSEQAFGCKPVVLSLPYRRVLQPSEQAGFTLILSGCNSRISEAFSRYGTFWLHVAPARNNGVNGFSVRPERMGPAERGAWQPIAPTSIRSETGTLRLASDDWPFLYLRDRLIPDLNLRLTIELGLLAIAMVWFFLPNKGGRSAGIDGRMFFLGASFMLLETKAVAQSSLLFGNTWLVNSIVSSAALTLVLAANLFVLRFPRTRTAWHYVGLLCLLLAAIAIPMDTFLSASVTWRFVLTGALALGPMFFAGVIFAGAFSQSSDPGWAFGSYIAGSVVGGLSESFSMLIGFRYLLLLALAFYIFSILTPPQPRISTA